MISYMVLNKPPLANEALWISSISKEGYELVTACGGDSIIESDRLYYFKKIVCPPL